MITLELARQLKAAGLIWKAAPNDFFAIPDREMDERIFVLADLQAQLDLFRGWPVITFHGTAEWALDYILTSEVVWMPRDEQLLQEVLSHFPETASYPLVLKCDAQGVSCTFDWQGEPIRCEGATAADAYAKTLLFLLELQQST